MRQVTFPTCVWSTTDFSKLPVRQVTGRQLGDVNSPFSKLPVRQVTFEPDCENLKIISKLPVRQVTLNLIAKI